MSGPWKEMEDKKKVFAEVKTTLKARKKAQARENHNDVCGGPVGGNHTDPKWKRTKIKND